MNKKRWIINIEVYKDLVEVNRERCGNSTLCNLLWQNLLSIGKEESKKYPREGGQGIDNHKKFLDRRPGDEIYEIGLEKDLEVLMYTLKIRCLSLNLQGFREGWLGFR